MSAGTKFCWFHLYQSQQGDVAMPPMPSTDPDPETAVVTLDKMLKAHYADPLRPDVSRPARGRFILSDGTVYAEVWIMPDGTIERQP